MGRELLAPFAKVNNPMVGLVRVIHSLLLAAYGALGNAGSVSTDQSSLAGEVEGMKVRSFHLLYIC